MISPQIVDICDQIIEISFELRIETILMLLIICYLSMLMIICGPFIDPHNNRLPVGLTAQLVEQCTGVAEVRVPVPFRPEFLRPFLPWCLTLISGTRISKSNTPNTKKVLLISLLKLNHPTHPFSFKLSRQLKFN